MSAPSRHVGEWNLLSNRLRRSLRILSMSKFYSNEVDDEGVHGKDEDDDDKASDENPHIPQGLEPHYARQYRCVHTFKGSTLEGVQKAPCLGAMPDHVELLVVCKGCAGSNLGEGSFRAHCVRCYEAFQEEIPKTITGRSRHWSLQKICLQDGDAGNVFKALNYVDWKKLSKWQTEGDLLKEIPLVASLVEALEKPALQAVRSSVNNALSFHSKSEFSTLFPTKKERLFNDTGGSPNRQQLFGMWQLGACPSCCQGAIPLPRPLDIVVPPPKLKQIVIPPVDVPIVVATAAKSHDVNTERHEETMPAKSEPETPTDSSTATTAAAAKSETTPKPLEYPTTRAFELPSVPLASLSGKSGKVLLLETVVSRAIAASEAENFKGRFQEDIGNIGIRIVQEDPAYRRMVKSSPADDSPDKYDAVFSLIRTEETIAEGSQLISMKMLHVVYNFLQKKFGSGPEASKKAQRFMYLVFGIWRRCGWYLAKSKENASRGNETVTESMDSTNQLDGRKIRESKRKAAPAEWRPKVNKGMRSLAAAALTLGLRRISRRSNRTSGAFGHAGGLTLNDVRVAATSEYLAGGLPRNNLSSTVVIPELDEEVGCRIARVFYIKATRKESDESAPATANPNAAIPRFGFQVKSDKASFFNKLESAIADTAKDDTENADLFEFFELFSASMEDAAAVLKEYNRVTDSNLFANALELEDKALKGAPGLSALKRLACRNVVSASGAANGGHRDHYGGQSNKSNERLEMKITCPAPKNGSSKFPCDDGVCCYDWVNYEVKLADWTMEFGPKHGDAPPGCLVFPELLLGTICFWNADIEFHILDRLFHCSARVGVPDDYLHGKPETFSKKVQKALLECNRGVWGLDDDLTPRFYPYGGSITTYRKFNKK